MTDYRSMYDKDYIGAWDLTDGDRTITITRVKGGELHNPGTKKKSKKPVVYFEGSEKGFCLNATNGKTIAALYGVHVEKWTGKQITLYKSMTRSPDGSGDVECLRVRPQVPTRTGKGRPSTVTGDPEEGNLDTAFPVTAAQAGTPSAGNAEEVIPLSSSAPAAAVSEDEKALNACQGLDTLAEEFAERQAECKRTKDRERLEKLVAAKDKRKAELMKMAPEL